MTNGNVESFIQKAREAAAKPADAAPVPETAEKTTASFHATPDEIMAGTSGNAVKSKGFKIPRVTAPAQDDTEETVDDQPKGPNWKRNRDRRGSRPWAKSTNAGSNQSNALHGTKPKPGPSSLGAAKAVIRNKLSVMYRGMRGLDAAQEAFQMCNVDIQLDVHDAQTNAPKRKRPFKGKNGQKGAAKGNRKPPKKDASKDGNAEGAAGSDS